MDEPRGLVGVSWMVRRTGLERTTVKRGAASGRIPGATKLLGRWRFDPDAIEHWITSSMTSQTEESGRVQAEPSRPAPKPDRQRGDVSSVPGPSNLPPLAVIFKDAPWRGVHDMEPAEQPERQTGRRGAGARKTGLSR